MCPSSTVAPTDSFFPLSSKVFSTVLSFPYVIYPLCAIVARRSAERADQLQALRRRHTRPPAAIVSFFPNFLSLFEASRKHPLTTYHSPHYHSRKKRLGRRRGRRVGATSLATIINRPLPPQLKLKLKLRPLFIILCSFYFLLSFPAKIFRS